MPTLDCIDAGSNKTISGSRNGFLSLLADNAGKLLDQLRIDSVFSFLTIPCPG